MKQGKNYTLAQWLKVWYEVYNLPTVKTSTAERTKNVIDLICRTHYADCKISEMTEISLQSILNTVKNIKHGRKEYSESTLKKVKSVLRQSFQKAKAEKLIAYNPAVDIIIPKAPKKKVLPLTHFQEEKLQIACNDDAIGNVYLFFLLTGLRLAELTNLKKADYDSAESKIFIRNSKTAAGVRYVYLVAEAKKIIEDELKKPSRDDYIFHNAVGTPLSFNNVQRLTHRLRATTNITNLSPHVCRHTFVTRLCEKGVSAKAIAQIIGHAGTGYVLDIYAQLEQKELRRAIYALDESQQHNVTVTFSAPLYNKLVLKATEQQISIDEFIFSAIKNTVQYD